MRQEVFYLAYHLHWSWSEIMDLDVTERQAYVGLLAERIEKENEDMAALQKRLQ